MRLASKARFARPHVPALAQHRVELVDPCHVEVVVEEDREVDDVLTLGAVGAATIVEEAVPEVVVVEGVWAGDDDRGSADDDSAVVMASGGATLVGGRGRRPRNSTASDSLPPNPS